MPAKLMLVRELSAGAAGTFIAYFEILLFSFLLSRGD